MWSGYIQTVIFYIYFSEIRTFHLYLKLNNFFSSKTSGGNIYYVNNVLILRKNSYPIFSNTYYEFNK